MTGTGGPGGPRSQAPREAMASSPEVKGTDAAGATPARWRIALVEDDEDLAFTLLYSLRKDGRFDPVRYAGGLVALDEMTERPPDLVLLDLNLPDVDGLTICRELRRHEATRRVPS